MQVRQETGQILERHSPQNIQICAPRSAMLDDGNLREIGGSAYVLPSLLHHLP
jgi:hypothetical protein